MIEIKSYNEYIELNELSGSFKKPNSKENVRYNLILLGINPENINDDLTVDVFHSVILNNKKFRNLPVHFNSIQGDFECSHSYLTSYVGMPKYVGGSFSISSKTPDKAPKTLEHCPEFVGLSYDCSACGLTSLVGAPKEIGFKLRNNSNWDGRFVCSINNLNNFTGFPEIVNGPIWCSNNKELTSIIGLPDGYDLMNLSLDVKKQGLIWEWADIQLENNISYIDSLMHWIYEETIENSSIPKWFLDKWDYLFEINQYKHEN